MVVFRPPLSTSYRKQCFFGAAFIPLFYPIFPIHISFLPTSYDFSEVAASGFEPRTSYKMPPHQAIGLVLHIYYYNYIEYIEILVDDDKKKIFLEHQTGHFFIPSK